MSKCSASISSRLHSYSNSTRRFNPFLWRHSECIISGFSFKPTEFGGFKIRVVQRLPETKILNRHSVAHPVVYGEAGVFRPKFRHVGKADEIHPVDFHNANSSSFDVKFICLSHLDSSRLEKVCFFSSPMLRLLSRSREYHSQKRCNHYTKNLLFYAPRSDCLNSSLNPARSSLVMVCCRSRLLPSHFY